MLIRTAVCDLSVRSDGRTVCGIAMPWDTTATVSDGGPAYSERFERGAFARTLAERSSRVKALVNHDRRSLPVGRATHLEETADGLYVELTLSRTAAADEALTLVQDKALDAFSVGFKPLRHRTEGRTTVRTEVRLDEVSIVAFPAYDDARVAAVRSADHLRIARERLHVARLSAAPYLP